MNAYTPIHVVDELRAEIKRLRAERDALSAEVQRLTNELYVDGIAPVPEPHS